MTDARTYRTASLAVATSDVSVRGIGPGITIDLTCGVCVTQLDDETLG